MREPGQRLKILPARSWSFARRWPVLLLCLAWGCSSDRSAQQRFSRVITPQPPPFLTGASSLLLTNSNGFSAWVDLLSETSMGSEKTSAGQLLGKAGKLLYAPEGAESEKAQRKSGGYSFIWDVGQSRGYVLSEALQGYAPVTADLHVTNLLISPGVAPSQRVDGHPCETANVSALTTDGSLSTFAVSRALDLRNFPVKIQTQTNALSFTLNLSKVRFESLSDEVFAPPQGFTSYPNPQAMADELAARQHSFHRKQNEPVGQLPDFSRPAY